MPARRGLERGDHSADGPVQEPAGDPGRQVHPAEAAAARGADARTKDRAQLSERSVTCGESRRHWCTICGKTATGESGGGGSPGSADHPGIPFKLKSVYLLDV